MRALGRTRSKNLADTDLRLGEMARKAAEFGDPYAMAAFALAALATRSEACCCLASVRARLRWASATGQ